MAVAEVLDVKLTWVADPDPGAAAILAHHWPDVPNLGDITAVDWTTVPPIDVLAAGFPCQDISYAGRGAGIKEGTRSGLWHTIADAVRVLRPRLLVLENVRAIISRRPGLDVVLGDLARLGFDAEWTCVRASDVGAPHQRWRWFLLAWPADAGRPRLEGRRVRGAAPERGGAAADSADLGHERGRFARRRWPGPADGGVPAADADGLGRERQRRHAGTETGRPSPSTLGPRSPRSGRAATDAHRGGQRPDERDLRPWQPDTAGGLAAHPDGRGRGTEPRLVGGERAEERVPADITWGDYEPAIRRWERILGRSAPNPTEPGAAGKPRLSPRFVEWLMGLAAGHVTAVPGLTRNAQLTALGNGVVPAQGAAALALLLDRMGAAA